MAQVRADNTPMTCPVCGGRVAANQVEAHLRQKHQIFQFRGERRSATDTVSHLLGLVCKPPGDREAWQTLQAVCSEQHGASADRFLAASLLALLARLEGAKREPAVQALAN